MARSFTLCLVVTLLMVFTVIEASREQTNQDGQKVQNRGTARYHHSRLTSQSSDFTALTTKLPRNKSSPAETASNFEKYETHFRRENSSRSRSRTSDDSVVTSRTNARYLNSSVDNSRNRSKLHTLQVVKEELTKSRHDNNKENIPESQTPKQQASRRTSSDASSIWIDSAKLDHEVFTKSPDYSRSRTGRKIYTSNGKGLRSQIILSRELANENMEKDKNPIGKLEKEKTQLTRPRIENITSTNISRVIDMKNATSSGHKEESIKERDVLPLNSENVLKIDIPLTVKNGKDVNLLTSTTISSVNVSSRQASRLIKKVESNDIVGSNTKKSKQSDRSKSRDISNANNSEIMNSESIARRNSSRMAEDTGNTETNERSSRRRANIKNVNSRSRSAYKSKDTTETRGNGRNKNVDVNSETNANRQIKTRRNLSNNERMSEGKRRSKNDRKLKVTEAKIDKQNAQAQRNSSRPGNNLDIITTIPKATIAEVTTVSSLDTEIATLSSTTIRSSTVARIFSSSTEQISRSKERNRKEDSQVKKFPKEDFFNHGLGFRGRKISIIEGSSSTIADLKTTTSKSETQLRGNLGWTLKRRPNYVNHDISSTSASVNRNQSNEIILPNDLSKSTEAPLSNAKVPRRGTKRPKATKDESNIVSSVAPKNVTRGSKTFHKAEGLGLSKETESEESDNYPLAFRARLFQSQNSNLKFIGEKSTTGTSLQATKSSPAILFSERSKLKLDLARRLIKPDLNIDENNLNKTISVPSNKSQMKEISIVNKDKNVEKTTKATNKLDRSTIIANTQKEKLIVRDRWKILEGRKSKDRNIEDSFRSTTYKKSQAPSERTIISSTVEGTSMNTITKFNNIPRRITHRNTISMEETTTAANIDMTKARSSMLQSTTVPREEMSTNTVKALDENNIITTIKLLKLDKTSTEIIKSHKQERNKDDIQKETSVRLGTTSVTDAFIESLNIHTTEFPHEIALPPTIIRPSSIHLSTTESKKLYPVYIPDAKKHDSRNKDKFVNDASKNGFQPRYTKQQEPDKMTISTVTSMTVGPTSRYIRKKSGVFVPFSTEATFPQTKHREYRPRTATYRRHSEVSTSQLTLQQSTKTDKETTTDSVTITPTPTKYQVTARSRFNSSEPLVSVKINTSNSNKPLIFTESSNSNSSASNIFNPTKSAFFSQNNTLLEQLRSTVAPLLNTLNEKTPIFSGAYSNVNIESSAPRITPNGSPPRFSARYKGAELFVRKPSIDQVVIPSVTTSSTTASTLIKNSDLAPPVNSPGEPRFVTFYQALESASIRNENLGVNDVSQRQKLTGGVMKVDSNATVPNGISNDTANNNDTTSPISASIATTSFPDITTIDITTAVKSANLSFASRLATEIIPNSTPKITSTTIQIPANPSTSGQMTTTTIMEASGTSASDDTMTNTLVSANVSNTLMLLNVTTTEIAATESLRNINVTSDTLLSTESIFDNVRPTESMGISTMEVTPPSTIETVITDVSMPASLNQISTNISDTTPSTTTESITATQISTGGTTMSMNDIFDNIESNTVQQYDETTPQMTETNNGVENIELNTIQQFDVTISSQMIEATSTTESITTEELSNDVTESQVTQEPVVTFSTRFDITQNILSHLQNNFSTVKTFIQKPTIKINSPKLFNTISDSSINTENLEETTTMWETKSENIGILTNQDVNIESTQTTTNRLAQKNIQNITGLATAFSIAHNRSNDQEANAQNIPSLNMTQNARNLSIDAEIMTSLRFADFNIKNDSWSSNDTLLTKLMTIAKTLFSEEINETQQSLLMPDQIYDVETAIVPDINNLTQADVMIENDDNNQLVLLNDTSEKTNAVAKLSTVLENISERTDVIIFGNSTEENFNRGPTVGSEISLMELNARPTDIKNLIDDTTATTIAQGTVIGSRIIQPEQPTEITTSIFTTSSEFPAVDTTTILSSSIEPTTDTATTTSTSTITTTTLQMTSTKSSSRADLATIVGSMPETTIPAIDINENLISTETTSTTIASIESEGLTTTTITPMPKTTIISPTTQITTTDQIISRPPLTSFGVPNMGSYLGSFGGNQVTPASRVSSSSKAPIRDYQIYGIYPNKTIVRKRPEDNLIDARNINSPYVIFGIFPDGRLVRKFPNGTVIPDSPRNPVEVVFTLSTTTTTNRPASGAYYNQVNQMGTYNQYQSPVYYSRPVDKLMGGIQSPGSVDFGLTSNAIGVPSGVGPKFATSFGPPASAPCANKMSNILLNTPNVASVFGKLQDPIGSSILPNRERSEASRTIITSNQRSSVYIGQDKFINYQIDGAPDINPKVVDVKINSVATSMNEGVASIPSFKNLLSNQSGGGKVTTSPGFPWKDPLDQIFGITTNSPMQTASVTSNQLNEPGENNVPIMARPINSLVEVFTPVMNSVTPTNPESKPTVSISSTTTTAPIITTIPVPITVATTTAPTTTTTTTTIAATTAPTTTTTTTTTAATTAPTTTTTTTTIATTAPTTTTTTTTTTAATTTTSTTTTSTTTLPTMTTSSISTAPRLATTASSINANTLASDVTIRSNTVPLSSTATISADNILNRLQMNTKENPFGATFEDLTFLNSLLQNNNVKTTAKTLNDIEQMLANRILELALAKPGPTRSSKAIKTVSSNNDLNAMKDFSSPESSSEPIIIDLLPSSSTLSPTVSSSTTTKKYTEAKTTRLVESSVPITTTKAPVVITAKSKTTTKRPRTTTQASVGFGVNLWRALFGSNRFETTTTTSTKKKPRPLTPKSVQTAQKSIEITQKPIEAVKSTTHTSHIMSAIRSHTTPRSVDISDIQVVSTKLHANNVDFASTSTPSSISTQRTLLNNPNPRLHDISTSTYSSEDDAKFLVALLRAIQTDSKTSTSTTPKIIEDDEAFLRAILNNQASISTATPSSTELNSAALLALLLKQQGIEPSTPAIKFREQLQLANLDLTTTQSTTTTTNKPAFSSSTQSVVSTRRKTTTPRQSSRSSLRTPGYTWSPSSTYPPPLFGENSGSGLITATRAIGQFLGSAITGAAQQLQSFLRNRRA